MRPVTSVLTGVSPLMLAREALWRTTRRWKRLRFLAALRRIYPVRYCPVGYYHPSVEQYPVAARRTLLCYAEKRAPSGYWILLHRRVVVTYRTVSNRGDTPERDRKSTRLN